MRYRIIGVIVVSAAAAFASAPSAHAASFTVVPIPFEPIAFNDSLDVVGVVAGVAPDWKQQGKLRKASGEVVAAGLDRPTIIANDGTMLGWSNATGATLYMMRNGEVVWSGTGQENQTLYAGGVGPAGIGTWLAGTLLETNLQVVGTSTPIASFAHPGSGKRVFGATDGAMVVAVDWDEDGWQGTTRYLNPSGATASWGSYQQGVAVGPEGRVLTVSAQSGQLLLHVVDTKSGAIRSSTDPGFPSGFDSFQEHTYAAVNAKGRILIETSDGDRPGATDTGEFSGLHTWTKDGGWTTITPAEAGAAAGQNVRALGVNGWGDMLVAYTSSTPGGTVDAGAILQQPRAALTGQIVNAAASGRAKRPKPVSVAGKTVRLTGGPVELVAETNAKGRFRFDVAPGSGYAVVPPVGACVLVGNGCFSSVPATISETGAKVNLASATVRGTASFTAKRNTLVKAGRTGRVPLKVRCSAATACRVKVTIKQGRTVFGASALTTVRVGKTKVVQVQLDRKARTKVAVAKRPLAITGTLAATAAGAKSTVVLGLRLGR